MSDTRQVTTWTEVDRATRSTVTLAVHDAPTYTALHPVIIQPATVTLWLTDTELTRVGFEGDITAGPGTKSGGRIALSWLLDDRDCPEWLLNLAMDAT